MSKILMSGLTKRILYYIASAVLWLGAVAGVVLLTVYSDLFASGSDDYFVIAPLFIASFLVFPLHTTLHEAGHALAGIATGMRVVSLSIGSVCIDRRTKLSVRFRIFSDASGSAVVLPQREKGARGKLLFTLFAGSGLELAYGAAMLALYFALPYHPALMFFVLYAPFALAEGVISLLPADVSGRTDGEFARLLLKKDTAAMLALRVMTAQGMLYRHTYAELPDPVLEVGGVVREDDVALLANYQLNLRRELFCGRDGAAYAERLANALDFLSGEDREEVAADLVYVYAMQKDGRAEQLREELNGKTAASLRALAALEPTKENISRAEQLAKKLCAKGERVLESALLARLKQ